MMVVVAIIALISAIVALQRALEQGAAWRRTLPYLVFAMICVFGVVLRHDTQSLLLARICFAGGGVAGIVSLFATVILVLDTLSESILARFRCYDFQGGWSSPETHGPNPRWPF